MSTALMRIIVSVAVMSSFFAFGLFGTQTFAQTTNTTTPTNGVDPSNFGYQNIGQYFGASKTATAKEIVPGEAYKDPRDLAKNIINIILGFLGIIAVIIIIMAGFTWMTAGGEEDKVTEARQRLIQGAIGLVLIIAAWMIAYFVIDQLIKAVQG